MECVSMGPLISFRFHLSREDGVLGSLTARFQRECQLSAQTVLSRGKRPVGLLAGKSERSGSSAQRTAAQDFADQKTSKRLDACVASTGRGLSPKRHWLDNAQKMAFVPKVTLTPSKRVLLPRRKSRYSSVLEPRHAHAFSVGSPADEGQA